MLAGVNVRAAVSSCEVPQPLSCQEFSSAQLSPIHLLGTTQYKPPPWPSARLMPPNERKTGARSRIAIRRVHFVRYQS